MDKLHQIFTLSVPFLQSIKSIRYLSMICKSMVAEEEALFHAFLIMLRDNVNEWFLDIFLNKKFFDYNFVKLNKDAMEFLNFTPGLKIKSWKTLAYFLDINLELNPIDVAAPSMFRTVTPAVALMHHIDRMKEKLKIIKNRMLKNKANLHNFKSHLALQMSNYNQKVKKIGILTSSLPDVLSSMQKIVFETDIADFEIQKNIIKKICSQITRDLPVIRTMLHELDHHNRLLRQRKNLYIKTQTDYVDAKQIFDRKRNSYLLCIYNVNMDMIKGNGLKNA